MSSNIEIILEREALKAEIVGMIADNDERKLNGLSSFNYTGVPLPA